MSLIATKDIPYCSAIQHNGA